MKRRPPISTRTNTLFPYKTFYPSTRKARAHTCASAPGKRTSVCSCCFQLAPVGRVQVGAACGRTRRPPGGAARRVSKRKGRGSIGLPAVQPGHQFAQRRALVAQHLLAALGGRSEEHTSELQSLMRISYSGFWLEKKNISTLTDHEKVYHITDKHKVIYIMRKRRQKDKEILLRK